MHLLSWLLVASASPVEEIDVVGERSAERGGSVTVIEVDDRLPATADLPSVVELAPGTIVRRLGGLGALSTASIRGSSARQVEVLLDGVPLNPDGGAGMDLSELPLRALARVEVHRGAPPPDLPVSPVGGVIQLVTADRRGQEAALTAGSLGAVRATGSWAGPAPGGDALVVVDALGAANQFRYFDDNGTVYVSDDDTFQTRDNADRRQGAAHLRYRVGDDRLRLTLLHGLLAREEGVPGFTFATTDEVRFGVVRGLQAAEVSGVTGRTRLSALGWVVARRERLLDPLGEIGSRRDQQDDALSPGLRASVRFTAARELALLGSVEARADRMSTRDLAGRGDFTRAGRLVGRASGGASVHLLDDRLDLTPVVVGTILDDGETRVRSVDPRLSARLDLRDDLALTAHVGRYLRPPDLVELHGDRGAVVGNPALRPERGRQADVGLVVTRPGARVEVVAFENRATDRIVLVQNAQRRAVPVNLDGSRVWGVEAAGSLQIGPLESWTSLTRSWSAQRSDDPAYAGKRLPRLPDWEVQQRTAWVGGGWRVGHTLSHASPTWFDATNWYRSAPRTLHGAFLRVEDGRVSAELGLFNLLDRIVESVPRNPLVDDGQQAPQAVTDFVGQPLPGRTLLLTLRWTP